MQAPQGGPNAQIDARGDVLRARYDRDREARAREFHFEKRRLKRHIKHLRRTAGPYDVQTAEQQLKNLRDKYKRTEDDARSRYKMTRVRALRAAKAAYWNRLDSMQTDLFRLIREHQYGMGNEQQIVQAVLGVKAHRSNRQSFIQQYVRDNYGM